MKKRFVILCLIIAFALTSCGMNTSIKSSYNKKTKSITFSGSGEIGKLNARADDSEYIHVHIKDGISSVAADTFSAETDRRNKDIQTVGFSDDIKAIGDRAFSGCETLRDLNLPKNLETLGASAFEGCNTIRYIELGSKVSKIGKEAFKDCKAMTYAKFPENLVEIGEGAFENCDAFSVVNIPSSAVIGARAFYNCKKLIGVMIPESVEKIGEKAFGWYLDKGAEKKLKDFIIRGKKGTAAERYANENGFRFVEDRTPDFKVDLTEKTVVYKSLPRFGYIDAYSVLSERLMSYVDNGGRENYSPLDDEWFTDVDDWGEPDMFYEDYRTYLETDSINYEKYSKQLTDAVKSQYRTVGDYVISDFEDGVCINKFLFRKKNFPQDDKSYRTPITISVPSEIDGKKVLKLGEYLNGDVVEYYSEGFLTTIPDEYSITLKIPATVTDISASALDSVDEYRDDFFYSRGYITDIDVAADNPLYCSEDGVMYSKDKKWLLFFRPDPYDDSKPAKRQTFRVPESVEYIAATNLCQTRIDPEYTLVLGKNIKKIYSVLGWGECGTLSCKIKTAKNSYAEKWLKKQMDKHS